MAEGDFCQGESCAPHKSNQEEGNMCDQAITADFDPLLPFMNNIPTTPAV